jgi:hypothetical protein
MSVELFSARLAREQLERDFARDLESLRSPADDKQSERIAGSLKRLRFLLEKLARQSHNRNNVLQFRGRR